MGMKEEVMGLAEEVEATVGGCVRCIADKPGGRCLSEDTFECSDAICREVAKRLRAIVERGAEDVSVSAYDLLSDDDREALAWVREMGGVNALSMGFQDADNRRIELCSSLGIDLETGWADAMVAMRRRLMPEGMEWLLEVWPKWSNGEYCKFGDWWTAAKYGDYEPKQLRRLGFYTPEQLKEWEQDEGDNYGYEWNFMRPSDTNYRPDKAETPASKVLAADGEPLEVGQTVWRVTDGMSAAVERINGATGFIDSDGTPFEARYFTHKRPVLDADGVPIKEGNVVWTLDGGGPYMVTEPDPEHMHARVTCNTHDGKLDRGFEAAYLTHAKPEQDTWERIERGIERGKTYTDELVLSIVRRCRALAERGE